MTADMTPGKVGTIIITSTAMIQNLDTVHFIDDVFRNIHGYSSKTEYSYYDFFNNNKYRGILVHYYNEQHRTINGYNIAGDDVAIFQDGGNVIICAFSNKLITGVYTVPEVFYNKLDNLVTKYSLRGTPPARLK
jgi:hypothetical protein